MEKSRKPSIDEDLSVISDFYDRFPFPGDPLKDEPPPGFNWRWSFDDVHSYCSGVLPCRDNSSETLRILDAGCGSGVSTDYLAHLNPSSEILAVDISTGALNVAIERLHRSGGDELASVHFESRSLLDLDREGPFDYINSVGVLHHLTDPLSGLKALSSLLKPGGILHLFIYASGGRWEIRRVQKALKSLRVVDDKDLLKLGREFFTNLPKNNRLKRNHEERWAMECEFDVNFADMYLHPRETTFNLERLWELVDNSGLEFAEFSNPKVWSLERFLKGELLERAKAMSHRQQMILVEDLDPDISHFECFLSKGSIQKYEWKNDNDLLATTGKISRCIWGWPGKILHDSNMDRIELHRNSFKFLKTIENYPEMPFGLLPLEWGGSVTASTARDLLQSQLLLLYPL